MKEFIITPNEENKKLFDLFLDVAIVNKKVYALHKELETLSLKKKYLLAEFFKEMGILYPESEEMELSFKTMEESSLEKIIVRENKKSKPLDSKEMLRDVLKSIKNDLENLQENGED